MGRKPAIWYVNAARRTLQVAVPALAEPDDEWARGLLAPAEYALFQRLPREERAHGVQVAKCLAGSHREDRELLVAALLHDVGKLGTPQGALVRALTHVLPPSTADAGPRLTGLAGARQARTHHAAYGAELLRRAGSSARVVDLVARHHDTAHDVPELMALKECDERT